MIVSMQPIFVLKAADEIVNNSATLQNDNELFLTVEPATYLLDGWLRHQSPTAADLKLDFTSPSGTSGHWTSFGLMNTATTTSGDLLAETLTISQTCTAGGAGSNVAVVLKGTIVVTTAGTLQLRWAQQTATASDTTMRANSWLKLTRIA